MDLNTQLAELARTRKERKVSGLDWDYFNLLFEGTVFPDLPDLVIERIMSSLPCASRIKLFKEEGTLPCFSVQGALENGHIECLRNYEGINWSRVSLTMTAAYGRFECLEYAYKMGAIVYQSDVDILIDTHNGCLFWDIEDECDHPRCIELYEKLEWDKTACKPKSESGYICMPINL
jgi:hypothetical protein